MSRFVLFCFLLVCSITTFSQEDEGIVSVDSSTVILNATVTDVSGKHMPGLRREQFKVFENGVEQEIEFFEAETTPFAAVILIDTSGSMQQRISLARSAAIKFLEGLRENDSAKIYRFDSNVVQVQGFSSSTDISEKIFDLKANGMTALNDAIVQAAEDLSARSEKRRAIIVLSDGMDTISKRSSDKALKAALSANTLIYTVDMAAMQMTGKERQQNQSVLRNLAEKTGGVFIPTPGGPAMRAAFEKIVQELGNQYTIAYQPKDAAKDGKWRAIELRVAKANLSIRTRKGYHAGQSSRPIR